jgi:hypothetical protein
MPGRLFTPNVQRVQVLAERQRLPQTMLLKHCIDPPSIGTGGNDHGSVSGMFGSIETIGSASQRGKICVCHGLVAGIRRFLSGAPDTRTQIVKVMGFHPDRHLRVPVQDLPHQFGSGAGAAYDEDWLWQPCGHACLSQQTVLNRRKQ